MLPRSIEDIAWAAKQRVSSGLPEVRARGRFLRDLPFAVQGTQPIAEPGPRDFIICGLPRSGTSLLCAALVQPPRVVTALEPWDGLAMPPADLFAHLRRLIDDEGVIPGVLDTGRLLAHGEAAWSDDARRPLAAALAPGYWLGVKWPTYWQLLPVMRTTRFIVCVRHPADVVASFVQARGSLRNGLEYDTPFNDSLNSRLRSATRDRTKRRALLYEEAARSILPHLDRPNVLLVRYERWFEGADQLLAEIGEHLGVDVSSPLTKIRPRPDAQPRLTSRDRRAIHSLCGSARALGYDV
jgi:hypothetical protein